MLLALGLMVAGIGPALPDLAANAGSQVEALGAVFTALFAGALAAQLGVGFLNDRFGQRPTLGAGMLLLGGGALGMALSRALPLTLACAAVAGLGHGALVVTLHVLVAQLFPTRSVSALNLINVFFGIGAVSGPALAGLSLRVWDTALPTFYAATALVLPQLLLLPFLAIAREGQPGAEPAAEQPRDAAMYRSPLLWSLGALLLLYVGMEAGISGWMMRYLNVSAALPTTSAALLTSGYWLALTVGRTIGAAVGARLAPAALLARCLLGVLAGGLILSFSTGSLALSSAAIMLLGVSFGPVFPTTLAIASGLFPQAPGGATSLIVALGNVGGLVMPWLLVYVLENQGPRPSALLIGVSALAIGAVFRAYGLLRRRERRQPAPLNP